MIWYRHSKSPRNGWKMIGDLSKSYKFKIKGELNKGMGTNWV